MKLVNGPLGTYSPRQNIPTLGRIARVGKAIPCLRLPHGSALRGRPLGWALLRCHATREQPHQPRRHGEVEPHSRLVTRHSGAAERHGVANDELGVGVPHAIPGEVAPELQVCHGGGPCQQPPVLLVPSLACRTWRGLGWTLSSPSSGWSSSATCQDWGRLSSGLPFNLDPDAHFGRALQRAQLPVPYEDMPVSDLDLEYVAGAYAAPRQTRAWRQRVWEPCVS